VERRQSPWAALSAALSGRPFQSTQGGNCLACQLGVAVSCRQASQHGASVGAGGLFQNVNGPKGALLVGRQLLALVLRHDALDSHANLG
jgi:hypothetical protein